MVPLADKIDLIVDRHVATLKCLVKGYILQTSLTTTELEVQEYSKMKIM